MTVEPYNPYRRAADILYHLGERQQSVDQIPWLSLLPIVVRILLKVDLHGKVQFKTAS